jgi:hypothetical protein
MSSLHSLAEFLASLIAWFDSKEKGTAVVLFLTALFIFLAAASALRHRLLCIANSKRHNRCKSRNQRAVLVTGRPTKCGNENARRKCGPGDSLEPVPCDIAG